MQTRLDPCRSLYEEAAMLAETCLPPTHPVIPYTRIKRDEYLPKDSTGSVGENVTAHGVSQAKVPRSNEASRGVLPIQVQADPRRWNLAPAARRMETEGSGVSGGYMLRWRPAKESSASATKSTGALSSSKGDSDRRHPGSLERKVTSRHAEQNRTAPEELLPRLDGEDHRDRERTRHRRNPFVDWFEGDTSKTEERKRRMEDAYQDMFQKKLQHHRTSYILDFKRLTTDELFDNRTIYTNASHTLRTKQLAKNNLSRSMPVLREEKSARTRKKKKEDEFELLSIEAAAVQGLREQINKCHRSLQENTPKIPWQELGHEDHNDMGKKARGSLGHTVAHFAMGSAKKKEMQRHNVQNAAKLRDTARSPAKVRLSQTQR